MIAAEKSLPAGRRKILFVFPNRFAARNILETEIPNLLAGHEELAVTFVSLFPEDGEKVRAFNCPRFSWRPLRAPVDRVRVGLVETLPYFLKNLLYKAVHLLLLKRASSDALVYRFNKLHNFFVHRYWQERARGAVGGLEDVQQKLIDPKLAWPLPNSERLFSFLLRLRHWQWGNDYQVEALFDRERFDLIVVNFIQTSVVFPYYTAAWRRSIPVAGIVGSWDNPTTKGPLHSSSLYIVQNRFMAEQLIRHHGVTQEKIAVTGWPQMDVYKQAGIIEKRNSFLAAQGLDPNCRLLLFGTSTKRFGRHEPSIVRHLIERVEAGVYGPNVALIVRAHPADRLWRERFGPFAGRPNVVIEQPSYDDRGHLTNLLTHADIVMSTAGTISLDAAAFDTCGISIAFDGDLDLPAHESARMFYQFDHYASVTATGGTRLVGSFAELDGAIDEYLGNPAADAEKRQALRDYHLEPFDGCASKRLADLIYRLAASDPMIRPQTSAPRKRSLLFVLPNRFASRNTLESDLPRLLAACPGLAVTFASLYPEDEKRGRDLEDSAPFYGAAYPKSGKPG